MIPDWLKDNPREVVSEQCAIPLWVGTAPVWSDQHGGGFYAFMALEADGDTAWDCDHHHPDRGAAWACLRDKLLEIANG